jgi:hypothetical protein
MGLMQEEEKKSEVIDAEVLEIQKGLASGPSPEGIEEFQHSEGEDSITPTPQEKVSIPF